MNEQKSTILIACNTLTAIHGEIYHNHARFFYRLGRDYPQFEFKQLFARRLSIDRFRNTAAKMAVQFGCKYLLFIDDDMKFPHDMLGKLVSACERGFGIVAALNYIRGYPFKAMSFKVEDPDAPRRRLVNLTEEDIKEAVSSGSVIDSDAIGTAVCLIDTEVLKKTPAPWFITGPHHTEDIYFCIKAQEYIPGLKIGTHCGVITGHMLDPEIISYGTRSALLKYYETFMTPAEIEMQKEGDRGLGYIKENIDAALDRLNSDDETHS